MKIQLIDFGGRSPERAHANDAGADVFSQKDAVIRPGDICKLPLGFGLKIPDGYAGYIFPRSGLSSQGSVCELLPIDSGYTGEVHAIISNVENREYEIKMGDKVGQLVIMPVLIPDFTFENWKERGTGASGSTGGVTSCSVGSTLGELSTECIFCGASCLWLNRLKVPFTYSESRSFARRMES